MSGFEAEKNIFRQFPAILSSAEIGQFDQSAGRVRKSLSLKTPQKPSLLWSSLVKLVQRPVLSRGRLRGIRSTAIADTRPNIHTPVIFFVSLRGFFFRAFCCFREQKYGSLRTATQDLPWVSLTISSATRHYFLATEERNTAKFSHFLSGLFFWLLAVRLCVRRSFVQLFLISNDLRSNNHHLNHYIKSSVRRLVKTYGLESATAAAPGRSKPD